MYQQITLGRAPSHSELFSAEEFKFDSVVFGGVVVGGERLAAPPLSLSCYPHLFDSSVCTQDIQWLIFYVLK